MLDQLERLEDVIATDVSFDDYLEHFAAHYCEWVDGDVVQMAAAELPHNNLIGYLYSLLNGYFELQPLGRVVLQPFTMKMETLNRSREPDLLVVLRSNSGKLHKTYLDGAADICIEVVSDESIKRDYGDKFTEYEKAGVREYWILDRLRDQSHFYRLSDRERQGKRRYVRVIDSPDSIYQTPLLPQFRLHIPTLWQETLPGTISVARALEAMFGSE